MAAEQIPGTMAVAQRQAAALENFVELCGERGFTRDQALVILAVYRKNRAIKLDSVHGRYVVVHGAYWNEDVMERALEMGQQ
jgi:hypothetical protein